MRVSMFQIYRSNQYKQLQSQLTASQTFCGIKLAKFTFGIESDGFKMAILKLEQNDLSTMYSFTMYGCSKMCVIFAQATATQGKFRKDK